MGMKTKNIIMGALFLVLTSFSSDNLPKEFTDLLARANLTFTRPTDLIETNCIENRQMNYEYALKHPNKSFEVRYAIRPMDWKLENYKKEGGIHPNKVSVSLFQATLLNIGIDGTASGQLPGIGYFDSTAVKKEFNADWGASAFVNIGKQFGQDYKYCLAVTIHKNFVGDAYFFYVSDNKDEISKLMDPSFHSLKFK
jgi:hypothetical protein